MSATTPRDKAERCFAVARSTTHSGERENAIGRGMAICEREGLDLDLFDIPGRARSRVPDPPASRYREDLFRASRAPSSYSPEEMRDVLRRYQAEMGDMAAAFRQSHEQAREAEARNRAASRAFSEAINAAAAKAAAKAKLAKADQAAAVLWAAGWRVYPVDETKDRWTVEFKDELSECSAAELIQLAAVAKVNAAGRDASACPICGKPAAETRFGAPCYSCIPKAGA